MVEIIIEITLLVIFNKRKRLFTSKTSRSHPIIFTNLYCICKPNWCQDLSRELDIGLALIYPISITYITPTKESKNELTNNSNNKNSPNRYIADKIGFLLLILPISPLAWITGHYVDINDLYKANSTPLKRKEIVSGTSDMQWTVSTLRRAAIYLCLAISSLVIIMTVFLILSFTYTYQVHYSIMI
ncbi:unnamed protein product [Rhizophagus irregularis]|nr:unnamed protein product [Rhizophagus irregularis]